MQPLKTGKLKTEHLREENVKWLLVCYLVSHKPADLNNQKEESN